MSVLFGLFVSWPTVTVPWSPSGILCCGGHSHDSGLQSSVSWNVLQVSFVRNTEDEQKRVIKDIQDEVTTLSRLEHPNVIRCLGATKEATHFYIFVEWMPGGSVADLLHRYGAFTDRVVTSYLQQILRGTAYLHENRIIHRDIKGELAF